MNRKRALTLIVLVAAGGLITGCHGDPGTRVKRYIESGRRFSAEGKYREASIQFLNALRVDEDSSDAHYELARTYEHLGQFGAASEELERTLDVQPDNDQARIELGNLLFASGRNEEALIQANTALTDHPRSPDAHALRSSIAAAIGDHDRALSEIEQAIQLDPNRAAFHESRALLEAGDRGSSSSAEAELKEAIQLDPKSVNPRLLLAAFYSRTNRLSEAEKTGWDAVALDRGNLTVRANLAQIILKEGDSARAEQVLRQASKEAGDNLEGRRLIADFYAATGQFDKARTEFSALLAKYPHQAALQKAYIRLLITTRDFAAARTMLSNVEKEIPGDSEAAALEAILQLNQGDSDSAVNALRESARSFPQDAFIHYWLGKAALASGDVDLAQTSFRDAVALNPSERDAQQELARIAGSRGDMSLLDEAAEAAISASPRFAGGYVWRAVVETNRSKLSQAEADLNHALALSPQCWQAYLELGKLRFAEKRFGEGSALLEKSLASNPGAIEALRLLVGYDFLENRTGRALERVNAQLSKNAQNSLFYDLLAEVQIRDSHLEAATATVRKAIQLNTADGEAVMLYAQLASQLRLTSNAIEIWQKRSAAQPRDAGALAILGTLEESRGDLAQAEALYRRALEIQPGQPIAANNLAYRTVLSGKSSDLALGLAEAARVAMPDSPNTADTLAWTYYYKGTYASARDLLEEAVRTDPDSATMQFHLGMVYSKLKDKHKATLHLKKALSLSHDAGVANDARAALQGLG